MAKNNNEETNITYNKFVSMLTEAKVNIVHPITVYTSNLDNDAWVCCNYSGPGIKLPKSEIDFSDFNSIDTEKMKHCRTWSYIEK